VIAAIARNRRDRKDGKIAGITVIGRSRRDLKTTETQSGQFFNYPFTKLPIYQIRLISGKALVLLF
jgi:hypothetical protein